MLMRHCYIYAYSTIYFLPSVTSFLISSLISRHKKAFLLSQSESKEDSLDLFDYFDPLLSPHAYPNGISPDFHPITPQKAIFPTIMNSASQMPTSAPNMKTEFPPLDSTKIELDLFDPLLSPHMYPNGTPDQVVDYLSKENDFDNSVFMQQIRKVPEKVDVMPTIMTIPPHQNPAKSSVIDPDTFDPLLSPHMYSNGVPKALLNDDEHTPKPSEGTNLLDPSPFVSLLAVSESENDVAPLPNLIDTSERTTNLRELSSFDSSQGSVNPHDGMEDIVVGENSDTFGGVVGILLIDHGSRNLGSNRRLQELAQIYQQTLDSNRYLVAAAHMELASPSIPEALTWLRDRGVVHIVCHPYFLSAQGRHVSEDIPKIVNDAIQTWNINVPVVTTAPVGSQTDIMIGAIHSLVKESLPTQKK
jgi:CbiX